MAELVDSRAGVFPIPDALLLLLACPCAMCCGPCVSGRGRQAVGDLEVAHFQLTGGSDQIGNVMSPAI